MIASREKNHRDRIPFISKYPIRILPISAIYGGNASGKTNFFKAFEFARNLVVKGTPLEGIIHVNQFLLGDQMASFPTSFSFDLLIDEVIYTFSFSISNKVIIEEKLVRVTSGSEKTLYSRQNKKIRFDKSLKKNNAFLNYAFKGTRDNQLFLTNSVSQKVKNFKPVYDWFHQELILISPYTNFGPFEVFLDEENSLRNKMNNYLSELDTGISHLSSVNIKFENLPLPEIIKKDIQEKISDEKGMKFVDDEDNRFIIRLKDGKIVAKKLVTSHKRSDGSETNFEIDQEADGSKRLIDLLPAFIDISAKKSHSVFVIDELDRSLHTLLTRRLLENFLGTCSIESRSQLLFTTHDVLLMDQNLLRRDEMWIAERDVAGASTLKSFSEYKDVRIDNDIRKSYLQGRMGGIPRLLINEVLSSDSCDN
ncbi:AAA family ATPase [Candidatus Chlorobium masyuteum]|uniref:AAA family ATPase n=1 Tax=Candidatus Chlorobium masyuteum TaxID=2716876 RepID=UPI001AA04C0A|nr:ATP-binding protein [Candidatus Chlorobium masyuteum]